MCDICIPSWYVHNQCISRQIKWQRVGYITSVSEMTGEAVLLPLLLPLLEEEKKRGMERDAQGLKRKRSKSGGEKNKGRTWR